jgi:hypothetical protein
MVEGLISIRDLTLWNEIEKSRFQGSIAQHRIWVVLKKFLQQHGGLGVITSSKVIFDK